MKQEFLNIFSDKQIDAIKSIVRKNYWGNTDLIFGANTECNEADGYFTNLGKGKEFSGILSGISKTIKSTGSTVIRMCPDWWQDNSGDMMFFNMDLLECTSKDLNIWANE